MNNDAECHFRHTKRLPRGFKDNVFGDIKSRALAHWGARPYVYKLSSSGFRDGFCVFGKRALRFSHCALRASYSSLWRSR